MRGKTVIIIVLCAACRPAAAQDTAALSPAGEAWRCGIDAARRTAPDSAFMYLNKAFKQGIAEDSLYYLWAEIYLRKGELDTALALNYAVKTDTSAASAGFGRDVLNQRQAIFSSLGWDAEARGVGKKLNGSASSALHRLIPECNLNLSGGGYYENSAADRHYPNARASDSTTRFSNGTGAALLRVGWRLPLGNSHKLKIGGKLRVAGSRFSLPAQTVKGTDSADAAVGAFLRYSGLSEKINAGYAFSRKKDFLKNESFVHEFNAGSVVLTKNWIASLDMTFQYEYPLRRNYYYIMVYGDHEMDAKNTVGFNFVVSGLTEENLNLIDKQYFMYVDDAAVYTDATYATPLRSAVGLMSSMDSAGWSYSMPMSYWALQPQAHFERRLTRKVTLGVAGTYAVSWYPEKFTWYDVRYPEGMEPRDIGIRNPRTGEDKFIAFNKGDGQFYWVRSLRSMNNAVLDTLPVIFHDERRIDQGVTLGVYVKSSFARFGDVILDATIRRNFSTLMTLAPLDIQRWYGTVTLTWLFRFKPDEHP